MTDDDQLAILAAAHPFAKIAAITTELSAEIAPKWPVKVAKMKNFANLSPIT